MRMRMWMRMSKLLTVLEEVKPIFHVAEDDIQSFATNEIDTIP